VILGNYAFVRMFFYGVALLVVASGCGEKSAAEWHAKAQMLVADNVLRQLDVQVLAQAEYAEEQALALDSTLVEAALTLAALYETRGAYEDAAVLYRYLIEQNAELGSAYAGLGFALAAQGRYSGAMRAYQDALRRGERSALLYTRLGHVYQAL
jgi:tetratricopeptide (TPR) repeat protein